MGWWTDADRHFEHAAGLAAVAFSTNDDDLARLLHGLRVYAATMDDRIDPDVFDKVYDDLGALTKCGAPHIEAAAFGLRAMFNTIDPERTESRMNDWKVIADNLAVALEDCDKDIMVVHYAHCGTGFCTCESRALLVKIALAEYRERGAK